MEMLVHINPALAHVQPGATCGGAVLCGQVESPTELIFKDPYVAALECQNELPYCGIHGINTANRGNVSSKRLMEECSRPERMKACRCPFTFQTPQAEDKALDKAQVNYTVVNCYLLFDYLSQK